MITATPPPPSPAKLLHPPPPATTALPRQYLSPPPAKFHTSPDVEPLKALLIRQPNMSHINHPLATTDLMAQHHLTPDLTTYSVLLKSCIRSRNLRLGQLVHSKLTESDTPLDLVVLNSLVTFYSKRNDWVTAKSIFEGMDEKKDLVSSSAMISCFAHNGMESQSVATFADMLRFGECPNEFCLAAVIQACCRPDYARTGMVLFGFVMKTGYFESELCVGCALIDMFAKGRGDLGSAKKVFDGMPERNLVTWTLVIMTRCTQLGCPEDAIDLFVEMVLSGFVPDRFTFSTVVSACAGLGLLTFGQQLHNWVGKSSLCFNVAVGCSLFDIYAKMIEDQVSPDHFTFSSLLKACGNLSNCKVGEQVYNHAVKLGLASDSCVGNSLINMYARCGSIEDARKAFEILFEKDLVSYNTIVDCYAKNLDSDNAFELINQIGDTGIVVDAFTFASLLSGAASVGAVGFAKHGFAESQMLKAGIKPNEVTYIAVISACSHMGLISEGWKHFNLMYKEHGISPRMEHYACMVDLLGRSGFLEKAVDFINSMPFAADALVWHTLLGACRIHGSTELGKHAAKKILEQEPNDLAAYVLLSNLYTSTDKWEDSVEIRKCMEKFDKGSRL
ncbi:hypothetical protein RJ640_023216 [Escallonia rubra]|uniref:Pentatricopeptide repeat-containing protein n=1 Tax=Escallonia rubra TaxID=112253 RepID=A0AA88RAH8_9ASTE|nr:hypothetical protein RJ640_023216 [Escallonia rubra]